MAEPGVNVWATVDGVRVNPETGRYLEDRPDVHADSPGGDYRARNALWDAARNRVTLHAARNEFVSFQVIVEKEDTPCRASVRFDRLSGPGGASISGRNIALFKTWYVRVTQPSYGYPRTTLGPAWYPDALVPAPEGDSLSFEIPDAKCGIGATQRNQTVWVDIYVPRDRASAPPGVYRGEVAVALHGGMQRLDVELEVWDFALPDQIHCVGDIWNGSILKMSAEQELRYYQMAHRHRFQPGVYGYRPGLAVAGAAVTIDWGAYDARLKKYFDGSAFTDAHGYWGPGYGVPLDHVLLPFNCEKGDKTEGAWPTATPKEGRTPEFEAVWAETARLVRAHFDADPTWRNVRKIIFLNGLDESYNEAAYEKMIYYCNLLRRAGGQKWFEYRIDGGYSWRAMDALSGCVDLWICHTIGFDEKKVAHFRRKGVQPWFYGPMIYEQKANAACGSNTFLDLDLLTCRGVGWAAWKHKSGYCEWEFDAFFDRKNGVYDPEKAWTEATNYRSGTSEFNGSGLLIYRGGFIGSAEPVPSIRLKAHRRGFQDYEYFWLLKQAGCGGEADRLVNSVVHGVPFGIASVGNTNIWKNDPEAWDAARITAGKLLDGRSR